MVNIRSPKNMVNNWTNEQFILLIVSFFLIHCIHNIQYTIYSIINFRMMCKWTKVCFQKWEGSSSSHHSGVPLCTASATWNSQFPYLSPNHRITETVGHKYEKRSFYCYKHLEFVAEIFKAQIFVASIRSRAQTFEMWSHPTVMPWSAKLFWAMAFLCFMLKLVSLVCSSESGS